jgi:hypothetical protein
MPNSFELVITIVIAARSRAGAADAGQVAVKPAPGQRCIELE